MTDDRAGLAKEGHDAGDREQESAVLLRALEMHGRDLSREMAIIRKGVEAAFEEFERFQQPTDYGLDLGRIVQRLGVVAERLQGVEQSPLLRQGAEHYARTIERSGEDLARTVGQRLDSHARELVGACSALAAYTKSAYERRAQDRRMWIAAVAGLLAGILLTLFLPRMLPLSLEAGVAGVVMADSSWNAGITMMQQANPARWDELAAAAKLGLANRAEAAACREAAARAKKDQRCTITVAAPAQ